MSMYDTVIVRCPQCGTPAEFQSKSGICDLEKFLLDEAPDDVLRDINRHSPVTCAKCGVRFGVEVVGPRRPRTLIAHSVVWKDSKDSNAFAGPSGTPIAEGAVVASRVDQRRLRDGAHALDVSSNKPETVAEVRAQLEIVGDGIAALQSLDDLGPEANEKAERDQQELWARYDVLKQRLKELEDPQGEAVS